MRLKAEHVPHRCNLPPLPRWLRRDIEMYPHRFVRCDECGKVYKKCWGEYGWGWARKRFGLKKLEVAT